MGVIRYCCNETRTTEKARHRQGTGSKEHNAFKANQAPTLTALCRVAASSVCADRCAVCFGIVTPALLLAVVFYSHWQLGCSFC